MQRFSKVLSTAGRFSSRTIAQHRLLGVRQQSTYQKPAAGVNPAYDEAVKIIEAYKVKKNAEADRVAKEIKEAETKNVSAEDLAALRKKHFDILVERDINDAEVHWNAKNGNYDLTKPVYLHLKEMAWHARPLEVLMQRVLQMFVLPDLLDPRQVGVPPAQLNITLPSISAEPIEPGSRIEPQSARDQPEIELVTFHDDTRLHTIAMVDIDEPFPERQTFREQFHWVVSNAEFSKDKTRLDSGNGNVLLPYIPPHPARGSPVHRYAIVVFEQGAGGQERLENAEVSRDLVLREFAATHNLHPVGISFFRSEWNDTVDEIYTKVLNQHAPNFGPIPRIPSNIGPDGKKINAYENY